MGDGVASIIKLGEGILATLWNFRNTKIPGFLFFQICYTFAYGYKQ